MVFTIFVLKVSGVWKSYEIRCAQVISKLKYRAQVESKENAKKKRFVLCPRLLYWIKSSELEQKFKCEVESKSYKYGNV